MDTRQDDPALSILDDFRIHRDGERTAWGEALSTLAPDGSGRGERRRVEFDYALRVSEEAEANPVCTEEHPFLLVYNVTWDTGVPVHEEDRDRVKDRLYDRALEHAANQTDRGDCLQAHSGEQALPVRITAGPIPCVVAEADV